MANPETIKQVVQLIKEDKFEELQNLVPTPISPNTVVCLIFNFSILKKIFSKLQLIINPCIACIIY